MNTTKKNIPKLRFPEFKSEWKMKELGELINKLDAGISVKSIDRIALENEMSVLKTSCVSNGVFNINQNKAVVHKDEIKRLKETVSANSIIISRMNTPVLVGANAFVKKDNPNVFLPDRLWAAKINKNSDSLWVSLLLSSTKIRGQISSRATGTSNSMKNITKGDILTLPIIAPLLLEQQKIATFLSAVDKKITQLQSKKVLLQDYKKGLMQQIFSQTLRFQDNDGGDYADWEEKTLGEIGAVINGLTYSPNDIGNDGVLVLRSSNVQNRILTFDDNVYVNVEEGSYNPVEVNDILICVRNGSKRLIGKNAIIDEKNKGVAFGAFMAIYRSEYNSFLFHLFDTDYYKSEVHKNLGATINSINGSDLKKFKMPFPCKEEQTKIAHFLSAIDKKIGLVNRQLEQTQEFKKGLLQGMFV